MNAVSGLSFYIVVVSAFVMILCSSSNAQSTTSPSSVRTFLSELVGEWVGTCEQSAECDKPDKRYFHAVIKQLDDGSYEGKFQFFMNSDKGLTPCGETSVVTNFDSTGAAVSKIKGSGKVMVRDKLTDQRHELTETLSFTETGSLQSNGAGRISLSGMPLGLGKNGNVKVSHSEWLIKDGQLMIDQKMSVTFKALVISKSVDVQSHYVAKRGSDVSTLLTQGVNLTSPPKPPDAASPVN